MSEHLTEDDWEREIKKQGLDLPPEYTPLRDVGRLAIDPLEQMLAELKEE